MMKQISPILDMRKIVDGFMGSVVSRVSDVSLSLVIWLGFDVISM